MQSAQECFGIPNKSNPPDSEIYLDTTTGFGSSANKVPVWTNVVVNKGPDMIYRSNAVLGDSIVIVTTGIYALTLHANRAAAGLEYSFCKNLDASLFNTAPTSITAAQGRFMYAGGGSDARTSYTRICRLNAGDVIRVVTDGGALGNTAVLGSWVVTKISN